MNQLLLNPLTHHLMAKLECNIISFHGFCTTVTTMQFFAILAGLPSQHKDFTRLEHGNHQSDKVATYFVPLFMLSICYKKYEDIGSSIKSLPIKLKTKCKKKWRWLIKTWHTYNNNIVNLIAKKLIQNLHFYSRYGIFYV